MFGRSVASPGAAGDHGPWYYVFICLAFAAGAVLQRVSEHYFPNRGGSIIAVPLAILVLIVEAVQLCTTPDLTELDLRQDWTVAGVAQLLGLCVGPNYVLPCCLIKYGAPKSPQI